MVEESCRIQLSYNVNAPGGDCGNALLAAACKGKFGAMLLLLAKGADVNAQGGHYGNAL